MASVKQILSGLSTGFMAALLAGALMSYWAVSYTHLTLPTNREV